MGHNLEVAVDIADTISNASSKNLPLDVRNIASRLTQRHDVPGLSSEDIAAALKEEGEAAGVTIQ